MWKKFQNRSGRNHRFQTCRWQHHRVHIQRDQSRKSKSCEHELQRVKRFFIQRTIGIFSFVNRIVHGLGEGSQVATHGMNDSAKVRILMFVEVRNRTSIPSQSSQCWSFADYMNERQPCGIKRTQAYALIAAMKLRPLLPDFPRVAESGTWSERAIRPPQRLHTQ